MSSKVERSLAGSPALASRPPLPVRRVITEDVADVEEYDYAEPFDEQPVVANRNTPLILGIVGVGGIVALLLVAMIIGNLANRNKPVPQGGVIPGCGVLPHNGEE